jgi:hypothetical protein
MGYSFFFLLGNISFSPRRSVLFPRKSMLYQKAIKAASKETIEFCPHQPTLTPRISP